MAEVICKHCEEVIQEDEIHPNDGAITETIIGGEVVKGINRGHPNLCCDCFDLSHGIPLTYLNKERAAKGRKPLTKPWPERYDNDH